MSAESVYFCHLSLFTCQLYTKANKMMGSCKCSCHLDHSYNCCWGSSHLVSHSDFHSNNRHINICSHDQCWYTDLISDISLECIILIIGSGEISSINSEIIPSYILHQINVTFFKDVTGIILFKCLWSSGWWGGSCSVWFPCICRLYISLFLGTCTKSF